MMHDIWIELTLTEMMHVAQVGAMRHFESVMEGRKPGHGCDEGDSLIHHLLGAAGECAVGKFSGVYWSGHVRTFKGADIGAAVQVRTRSRHDYDLIVRDDDPVEHAFIHVTGQPPRLCIHGWMMGIDAKQPKWLKTYGDRPAAYFVPAFELRPMTKARAAA